MAASTWQWVFRGCLSIAGLLLGVGIWYLASWAARTAEPLHSEKLAIATLVLFFGFQFSLVAVAMARWKRGALSNHIAWTAYVVFGAIVAFGSVIAWPSKTCVKNHCQLAMRRSG